MLPTDLEKVPSLHAEKSDRARRKFLAEVAGLAAASALPAWAMEHAARSPRDKNHFQLACAPNPSIDHLTVFRAKEIAFETLGTPSQPPCLDLVRYRTIDDSAWAELEGIEWVTADFGLANLSPAALNWICNSIDLAGCYVEFCHLESISPDQLLRLCQTCCAYFKNVRTLTPTVIDFVSDQSRWIGDDGEEGAGYFSFSGNFPLDRKFAEAIARSHADLDFQTTGLGSFLTPDIAQLLTQHRGSFLGFEEARSRSRTKEVITPMPPHECLFPENGLMVLRSAPNKSIEIRQPTHSDSHWALSIQRCNHGAIA